MGYKNKIWFILILNILSFSRIYSLIKEAQELSKKNIYKAEFDYPDFNSWYIACKAKLPFFRKIGTNYKNTVLTLDEIKKAVNSFIKVMRDSSLSNSSYWLEKAPNKSDIFFTSEVPLKSIKPYVQKLVVSPNSTIALRGDLHGDIHSLNKFIKSLQDAGYMNKANGFKIKKNNFYIIFLGDYTDRGNYSTEVLYVLIRLKIENPENIFIIRGNHEDITINFNYGFLKEFKTKFLSQAELLSTELTSINKILYNKFIKLARIYDFFPVALYLGSGTNTEKNYFQCCHGGIEVGFNPKNLLAKTGNISYQWLGKLDQLKELENNIDLIPDYIKNKFKNFEPINYSQIGFLWNDFHVDPNSILTYDNNRGFAYGKKLTELRLLKNSTVANKVRGIFRAHQHSSSLTPMMKSILKPENPVSADRGISKLWPTKKNKNKNIWDSMVCTFLVAPDTAYGAGINYNYDAYGILKVAENFNNWILTLYRNIIIK